MAAKICVAMYSFLLISYLFIATIHAYRKDLGSYWIHVRDDLKNEYQQNGRVCEQCHFPFTHEDELYYGCRSYGDWDYACKNGNGVFIECPEPCPPGHTNFWKITASSGPDDNSVILECVGTGSPNPTMTWRKDGETVKVVTPPANPYPTNVNDSITLKYTPEAYGLYSCAIDNAHSSDTSDDSSILGSYDFTGERLPTIPTNLKVLSQHRGHITLGWDYDEVQPSDSKHRTSYTIHMVPGRPKEMGHLTAVLIRNKNYTLTNLEPGVQYTFKVKRANRYGDGLYSEPIQYTIPENIILDRPVNVTITKVDSTSVTLEWDFDGEAGKYDNRIIHITPGIDNQNRSSTGYFQANTRTINGLTPNTKYKIEVTHLVAYVYRRTADPVFVTTPPLAPRIENIWADDGDHSFVTLRCAAFGGPVPEVTWVGTDAPLPAEALVNTTVLGGTVTSVLTLPRNAFVYTNYKCKATSDIGEDYRVLTVHYEGNHPPVALEQMIRDLAEEVRQIKQDVDAIRNMVS